MAACLAERHITGCATEELKSGPFKPEWAGKLNFYLSAADDLMRTGQDAPTIGLLLCESHRSPIVEYTLRNIEKPIGVSSYRVTRELPAPNPRRGTNRRRSARSRYQASRRDRNSASGTPP